MGVHETRTFESGNGEAVRLPKGLGFGIGIDLRIERNGDTVVLRPAADPAAEPDWRRLFDDLNAIGRPGEIQDRADIAIDFPDRPGLY